MANVRCFLVFFGLTCLTVIEALLSQSNDRSAFNQRVEEITVKCTPGKFYKRGCKQCFCDESMRPVCGTGNNCDIADKAPLNPSVIRSYSRTELMKLPELTHQAAECKPGASYRVDCNACFCLANNNLMCNDFLCPSYNDVNRIQAKSLTGKPCSDVNTNECIKCTCTDSALVCESIPNCIPNKGRRNYQEESPLDLTRDGVNQDVSCTPNMVYRRDCNRCYCQKDNSLRCTLMKCLKNSEVKHLMKLRNQLEKTGL